MGDKIERLNKIKTIFNTKYKEQFISDSGVVLYATTEDEYEESKNLTNVMNDAIKLFNLLPELIENMEYLLEIDQEDSCIDAVSLSNNQDIREYLQQVKEAIR